MALIHKGYHIEIYTFVDGTRRMVSTHRIMRSRNCFKKLTAMLDAVSKTFGGLVAVTILPIAVDDTETEPTDEQRQQQTATPNATPEVQPELGPDVQGVEAATAEPEGPKV